MNVHIILKRAYISSIIWNYCLSVLITILKFVYYNCWINIV